MEVHKRIIFLREKKGITVNKLANLAGLSQSFIREIEMGIKKPSVETLSYICDALDVSLKDFFDDDLFNRHENDELFHEIFKLTAAQRKLLLYFLRSLHD